MKRILILLMVTAIAGCAATTKTEVKRGKKGCISTVPACHPLGISATPVQPIHAAPRATGLLPSRVTTPRNQGTTPSASTLPATPVAA
jgi:hypothetical protein